VLFHPFVVDLLNCLTHRYKSIF